MYHACHWVDHFTGQVLWFFFLFQVSSCFVNKTKSIEKVFCIWIYVVRPSIHQFKEQVNTKLRCKYIFSCFFFAFGNWCTKQKYWMWVCWVVKKSNLIWWNNLWFVYLKMIGSHWPACTQKLQCNFHLSLSLTIRAIHTYCTFPWQFMLFYSFNALTVLSSHRISLENILCYWTDYSRFFFSPSIWIFLYRTLLSAQLQRDGVLCTTNWRLKNRIFDFCRLFFSNHLFRSEGVNIQPTTIKKRVNADSIGCSCFQVSG